MAIKIYQTQVRPTIEVKERLSTSGMRVPMETAAAPGMALSNMLESGEKLYVKLEERKSRNSALDAKDKAINGIKDDKSRPCQRKFVCFQLAHSGSSTVCMHVSLYVVCVCGCVYVCVLIRIK